MWWAELCISSLPHSLRCGGIASALAFFFEKIWNTLEKTKKNANHAIKQIFSAMFQKICRKKAFAEISTKAGGAKADAATAVPGAFGAKAEDGRRCCRQRRGPSDPGVKRECHQNKLNKVNRVEQAEKNIKKNMINEDVFWSKQIETILIITSRDASMRYGSNRNWLPTIQNHMKIFNLRRYFKKIKKDIHASMEQKAKQTARKATLHTWNVACLQNRTDGSCLPHEPGRTSQSNSRNTIIPLTCEAFRSCFKLIRMHICRYIYI